MLFGAASETLLKYGHNPEFLGAQAGITMVLHTLATLDFNQIVL